MYMYNAEGQEALCTPDQVPALEAAGWSKEKLSVKAEGKAATESTGGSDSSDKPVNTKKILLKR